MTAAQYAAVKARAKTIVEREAARLGEPSAGLMAAIASIASKDEQ